MELWLGRTVNSVVQLQLYLWWWYKRSAARCGIVWCSLVSGSVNERSGTCGGRCS